MRRIIAYIVLCFVLAASLCGCGDAMVDNEVSVTSTPAVTARPSASPKADDGAVNDTDGIIGRDDNNSNSMASDRPIIDRDDEDAKVNTQPKVTAEVSTAPTATAKP